MITIDRDTKVNDGVLEIDDVVVREDGSVSLTVNDISYEVAKAYREGVLAVTKDQGLPYFVDTTKGPLAAWTCTCPDFVYRCKGGKAGRTCKHCQAVYLIPAMS